MFRLIILLLVLTIAVTPVLAFAGPTCALTSEALSALETRYNERPFWAGLSDGGAQILSLTASPDGGTWTALVSDPDGRTCMIASGTSSSLPGPPAEPAGVEN